MNNVSSGVHGPAALRGLSAFFPFLSLLLFPSFINLQCAGDAAKHRVPLLNFQPRGTRDTAARMHRSARQPGATVVVGCLRSALASPCAGSRRKAGNGPSCSPHPAPPQLRRQKTKAKVWQPLRSEAAPTLPTPV